MHTQGQTSQGGWFRSAISGKKFEYVRDSTGANKRKALAQLTADDNAIRAAQNERAMREIGRPLTEREHISGQWVPDRRPEAERIRQDAAVTLSAVAEPDRSPFAGRIAELQSMRDRTTDPAALAKIDARLRPLVADDKAFTDKIEARKAHEAVMASSEVTTALAYGGAWVARLETDPSVPQEWVNGARDRLERLKLTGDHETFYRTNDEFEAVRKATLKQKTAALDAQAAAVRADADAVRRDAKATPIVESEGGQDA